MAWRRADKPFFITSLEKKSDIEIVQGQKQNSFKTFHMNIQNLTNKMLEIQVLLSKINLWNIGFNIGWEMMVWTRFTIVVTEEEAVTEAEE